MNDRVDANIADVRRLVAALDCYERDIAQVHQDFQLALDAAGWRDAGKQRFVGRFGALRRSTEAFVAQDLAELKSSLVGLAERMEQLRRWTAATEQ